MNLTFLRRNHPLNETTLIELIDEDVVGIIEGAPAGSVPAGFGGNPPCLPNFAADLA